MAAQANTTKRIARRQHGPARRYRAVTPLRDGWTTPVGQVRRVTIANDVSIWPHLAALALVVVGCRQGGSSPPASADTSALVMASAACAADSLHPVTAAPAAGLWVGGWPAGVRVAAMVGPASADGERARITRRVETLELRPGADSIRVVTDTASVTLELLPAYRAEGARAGESGSAEPAAVYAVSPLVRIASYEPCAARGDEPRIRYLRRDERGGVTTDLMLRRESAETKGLIR
jgi:hypothetical protein